MVRVRIYMGIFIQFDWHISIWNALILLFYLRSFFHFVSKIIFVHLCMFFYSYGYDYILRIFLLVFVLFRSSLCFVSSFVYFYLFHSLYYLVLHLILELVRAIHLILELRAGHVFIPFEIVSQHASTLTNANIQTTHAIELVIIVIQVLLIVFIPS